jgi:hypothetical protein
VEKVEQKKVDKIGIGLVAGAIVCVLTAVVMFLLL